MTRLRRPLAALAMSLAWLSLLAVGPAQVRAADVSFGDQHIESVYGTAITFTNAFGYRCTTLPIVSGAPTSVTSAMQRCRLPSAP